jgi:hypothetical protein
MTRRGVDSFTVALGWAYFGLRIVHSLVQATRNVIQLRFAVFTLGPLVLPAIWLRTLLRLVRRPPAQ